MSKNASARKTTNEDEAAAGEGIPGGSIVGTPDI